MKTSHKLIPMLLLTGAVALLALACGKSTEPETTNNGGDGDDTLVQLDGDREFTAVDLEGNDRNSTEWVGQKPLLVWFTGSWCYWCKVEAPDLVEAYDDYKDTNIEFVSLAVGDSQQSAQTFVDNYGITWPHLLINSNIARDWQVRGYPTIVLISSDGTEYGRVVGAQDHANLVRIIDQLLAAE